MDSVDINSDEGMAAAVLDMLDLPPIDDRADPFANLDPQWRRLARHLMENFDPSDLPMMLRPFAPAAQSILAAKLADDPEHSRTTALEMIDMVVRDLEITRNDLTCWDAGGAPLPPDA